MNKIVQVYVLVFPFLTGVYLYYGVSLLLTLLALETFKNRTKNITRIHSYFLVIFLCGLMSGIFHRSFLNWNFFRDFLIFMHVVILFRWFSNCSYPNKVLSWIGLSTFCYSFLLFIPFLFGGGLLGYSYMSRYDFNLESNYALIGLLSVLVNINYYKRIKFNNYRILILFFVFFILISASRINILSLICIGVLYYYKKFLPSWIPLFIILFGIICFVFLYRGSDSAFNDSELSFFGKLSNSYSEISINPQEGANINFLWRSHEAYLGLNDYLNSSFIDHLIGKGFGSFVDGSAIFDNKYQQIPFFHNGFITLLFKTGLIGIVSFLIFFIVTLRSYKLKGENDKLNKKFYSYSIVLLLFFSTLTIMGFYTTEFNSFLIILSSFSHNKHLNV